MLKPRDPTNAKPEPVRVNALMIDDDPESLLLMSMHLDAACGAELRFVLEGAPTLADGLARAAGGDFDVILLDLDLPDSSGLDTVSAARRRARETPIVVLTGLEDEQAGLQAIALGAQDYLVKDRLDRTLLSRAVRYAIERSRLLRSARELERLKAEVRERNKSDEDRGRVLAAVSHELRSPLTIAQTALAFLLEGEDERETLTPSQAEFVGMASRSLRRLERLIRNVLDFSRLESGTAALELGRVDARRLVAEVFADWKRALGRPLEASLDLPDDAAFVRTDPDLLVQVVLNLLDNAGRHAKGAVRVSLSDVAHRVRVTVEDDGPGVPAARAEEIFQPFVQLRRGQAPGYKGTGLGLAICREIGERSGGRVWLDAEAPAGARFHFELPRWAGEPAAAPAEGDTI